MPRPAPEVLAVTLNHEHLDSAAERAAARARVESETGRRAYFPLLEPLDPLVDRVLQHIAEERR